MTEYLLMGAIVAVALAPRVYRQQLRIVKDRYVRRVHAAQRERWLADQMHAAEVTGWINERQYEIREAMGL